MIGNTELCAGLYILTVPKPSVFSQCLSNKSSVSPQCWSVKNLESINQSSKDSAIML